MNRIATLFLAGFLLADCAGQKSPDAYGVFEAAETMVSAEVSGKLIHLDLLEGQLLRKGQHVATVDSTLPALQKQELLARRQSVRAKMVNAEAQIAVVQQQIDNMQVDLQRVRNMLQDDAATRKQLDDLVGADKILNKQLNAARAQRQTVVAELAAVNSNLDLISEQMRRCRVINPIDGTVLNKYCEAFEMTAAGKPLYKIANLDEMTLRIYISGAQMSAVKIGSSCTVRIDDGKKYIDYPGTIIWISDSAEFTPKIIQTKQDRVTLVYAVKVRVANDGAIKIGMPGEVIFTRPSE
ncbi:HlyD family efflux transporter periplasmic adaptor subunit [candidate division KSB1 bacterium]|nr:HlyD family efflux transporter periplasmic adaptor subunit [candidate division KSB1 bacterium]